MPPPPKTVPALDSAAFACMARLDDVRKALIVVNAHAMSRHVSARDFDYAARASAYVWVAAALEHFLKAFIGGLVDCINAAALLRKDLRVGLLTLDRAAAFQKLKAVVHPRDLKKWALQIDVQSSVIDSGVASLSTNEEDWPTDGSTLHRGHLEAVWSVFGLQPDPVPSPRTYGFLTDLRENRTRAAHGISDPISIGRQKSAQDVIDLIARAEELVIHIQQRGTAYVLKADYAR